MTDGYGGCTVRAEYGTTHEEFQLLGGERVFASVTDLAHAPLRGARALIASGGGRRFALAGA
jgi:hypothetical protein